VLSNNDDLDCLSHAKGYEGDSVKSSFEDIISMENYVQSYAKSKCRQTNILSNTRQCSVSTQPHAEPSTSISGKLNEGMSIYVGGGKNSPTPTVVMTMHISAQAILTRSIAKLPPS
jgi:hypothetical protein